MIRKRQFPPNRIYNINHFRHDELTIWNWKSITDYHIDLLCYFSETDDMGGVELVLNRRPSEEFSITIRDYSVDIVDFLGTIDRIKAKLLSERYIDQLLERVML
ncbi:17587_t:CDS:2, partial [Funneliformis geosporum]